MDFGEIAWNSASDMTVEMEEKGAPEIQEGQKQTIGGPYGAIRKKSARPNQNQEWETKMYRRVNDGSKKTRPEFQMYGWILIEKDVASPDYKSKTNVQSWGFLVQAEILEASNAPRVADRRMRGRMWDFDESRTQENRVETNRSINEMGGKFKILLKKNQVDIGEEIYTYVECVPVGMITEEMLGLRSRNP